MKLKYESIAFEPGGSFRIEERTAGPIDPPWHFHPEMELMLVVAGRGRRFVGDSVEYFAGGDLVLLGPNLPHSWSSDETVAPKTTGHSIVAHFRENFLGEDFVGAPELAAIRGLFAKAAHGLSFSGESAKRAAVELRALTRLQGSPALARLLVVLDHMTRAGARPLAGPSYLSCLNGVAEGRLKRVYSYLMEKFREPITLAEIAKTAAMSPTGFSRYFKGITDKNVSEFLTELRISYAATCLLETDHKIGNIAFESGFETLSSFNRQFLRLKKMQPRHYRAAFVKAHGETAARGAADKEDRPIVFIRKLPGAPSHVLTDGDDAVPAGDYHAFAPFGAPVRSIAKRIPA